MTSWSPGRLVIVGLPLLVGIIVALPTVLLMANSFNAAEAGQQATFGFKNWTDAFGSSATVSSLWNSLGLAVVRTAISMPLGIALTWLVTRTDMPGRAGIELLSWLSIFTPILPLTLGWIMLLDPKFGLINAGLAHLPFMHGKAFNVYSFWGITWVHLASSAIAFKVVLLAPAFRRVSASTEQAARVCGASLVQSVVKITLPLLAPAVLLVTLISLVFSFEAFEVELLLGTPARFYVYSTRIYDLVNNQPSNVGAATALAFIFVIWLLALAGAYRWFLRGKSFTTVTGSGYDTRPLRLGRWGAVASAASYGFFLVALAAPFVFLVLGSFMRVFGFFGGTVNPFTLGQWQALFADPAFGTGVKNTLIIASVSAVAVILIYSAVAYAIVRGRSGALQVVDFLVWSPWAMPGILMSLGLLWLFLATPLRTVLYGSVIGIIVAFVVRGSPLSTQFFKASLLQVGRDLEEAGRVCGGRWLLVYRRILLRLLAPTAITVGLLSFLQAVHDVPTAVLLYSANSRPLSILMLEYAFSGTRERGAAVGVLITGFVMIVLLGARFFGYRLSRERL
ncbi:MAG TPA: iron ABC transporter permease [Chloroflexota bacterium]|nr:iron ABC transporter permease [Chloroflexota bacterium]